MPAPALSGTPVTSKFNNLRDFPHIAKFLTSAEFGLLLINYMYFAGALSVKGIIRLPTEQCSSPGSSRHAYRIVATRGSIFENLLVSSACGSAAEFTWLFNRSLKNLFAEIVLANLSILEALF